jgi:hypothetical protein
VDEILLDSPGTIELPGMELSKIQLLKPPMV